VGLLKRKSLQNKNQKIWILRNQILQEAALISHDYIQNAASSFYHQIACCQTVEGAHFEQLI